MVVPLSSSTVPIVSSVEEIYTLEAILRAMSLSLKILCSTYHLNIL